MGKPQIISLIRVDEKIYNQDDLSENMLSFIVQKAIIAAASRIGFEVKELHREKTA